MEQSQDKIFVEIRHLGIFFLCSAIDIFANYLHIVKYYCVQI